MKYSFDKELNPESIKKWKDFTNKFKPEDLYIGGVCGLYYNLDIVEFISKRKSSDSVSVFFMCDIIGNDKRQLLITGDKFIQDEQVGSLPLYYIRNKSSQFNKTAIENHLRTIDEDFKTKNKNVTLVLNVPDEFLDGLILNNINIVYSKHLDFVLTNVHLLAKNLKLHYRRLQITKNIMLSKNSNKVSYTEYLYMISMAWNSVPYGYVRNLFHYVEEGTLNNYDNKDLSLVYWCKLHKVPINQELYDSLDEFTTCDNMLTVFNLSSSTDFVSDTSTVPQNNDLDTTSAIQAYQAMKRLVSFIQGKIGQSTVINPTRLLENHLEYEALVELHEYVKSQNETT